VAFLLVIISFSQEDYTKGLFTDSTVHSEIHNFCRRNTKSSCQLRVLLVARRLHTYGIM
jgi:hypothetical protein